MDESACDIKFSNGNVNLRQYRTILDLSPVNLQNLHQRLTNLQRSFQPKSTRLLATLIMRGFL